MKKLFSILLLLICLQTVAQVRLNDSTSTESFKVYTGSTFRGTFPKGGAYLDVDPSGKLGVKLLSGSQIVNYNTYSNFIVNGVTPSSAAAAQALISELLGVECCGGGVSSDTIVLDGNAFIVQGQNTALEIDGRIELDGDSVTFSGISSNDTSGNQIYLGIAEGVTPNTIALAKIINSNGEASIIGFTPLGIPVIGFNITGGGADYSIVYSQDGIVGEGEFPENVLSLQDDVAPGVLVYKNNGSLTHNGGYANKAYYVDDTPGGFKIPDNNYLAVYDPASLQAAATITMPANPVDGQIQVIAFGGTITSGTAVTALTLATTGGQTLNVGTAASTGLIEQPLTFLYIGYLNKWYLISK